MTSVIVTNMGSGAARSAFLVVINNYPVKNINKSQNFLIKQIRPMAAIKGVSHCLNSILHTKKREALCFIIVCW